MANSTVEDPLLADLLAEHVKDRIAKYWEDLRRPYNYEYPYLGTWAVDREYYVGTLYIRPKGETPITWQTIYVNRKNGGVF